LDERRNPRVQVVLNQLSRGKASGLNDALELAHGEVVVFTDVRQTLEGQGLRFLVEDFADPQVGCVSGELMLGDPAAALRAGVLPFVLFDLAKVVVATGIHAGWVRWKPPTSH